MGVGSRRPQRHRLHPLVRRERLPRAHRRRGQGLRPDCPSSRPRRRGGSTGTCCSGWRPLRRRSPTPRLDGTLRLDARGHPLRFRDRRHRRDHGAGRRPARPRRRSRVPVLHPQRARRRRVRSDRHLARLSRPELCARVGVRDRLDGGGGGGGADPARRRGRRPRRRRRGGHAPDDPRRLLRDARPRCRGGAPAARLAPVRRAALRLRHG